MRLRRFSREKLSPGNAKCNRSPWFSSAYLVGCQGISSALLIRVDLEGCPSAFRQIELPDVVTPLSFV